MTRFPLQLALLVGVVGLLCPPVTAQTAAECDALRRINVTYIPTAWRSSNTLASCSSIICSLPGILCNDTSAPNSPT